MHTNLFCSAQPSNTDTHTIHRLMWSHRHTHAHTHTLTLTLTHTHSYIYTDTGAQTQLIRPVFADEMSYF